MSRTRRGCLLMGVLTVVAGGLSGCGGASGGEEHVVGVHVTRDFGRIPVGASASDVAAPSTESALQVLARAHRVVQSADGRVLAIDGLRARPGAGWFLYVNGIRADKRPGDVRLHSGDRTWWDRHDGRAAPRIRAVVGAFPEPFVHGREGKRLPVRLECADDAQEACDIAAARLRDAGIGVVARARIGTTGGGESLRVLVGRWSEIRSDFVVRRLELGPGRSGVFARPSPDGRSIALLDDRGREARSARPGAGLVAATEDTEVEASPIWMATATTDAGVRQAAAALSEDALRGGFAVVVDDDLPTDLPVAAARSGFR